MRIIDSRETAELPERTVGLLGPAGTFTEMAAEKWSERRKDTQNSRLVEGASITEIIENVRKGAMQSGIVPDRNSTDGTVIDTRKQIIRGGFSITGEVITPIEMQWVAQQGAMPTEVWSKGTAIEQSDAWLRQHWPNIKRVAVDSTAQGILEASRNPHVAGIGSPTAAKALRLDLGNLDQITGIQTHKANATHFIAIERHLRIPPVHTPNVKTSLLIQTAKDTPGELIRLLGPFDKYKLNLTAINSVKDQEYPGNVYFLVDFDRHGYSPEALQAMDDLSKLNSGTAIRLLGIYERDPYIPPHTEDPLIITDSVVDRIRREEFPNGNKQQDNELLVAFALHDQPGALLRALTRAAERDVSFLRMGSHPSPRGVLDEHVFYAGIDTSSADVRTINEVLLEMQEQSMVMEILGKIA